MRIQGIKNQRNFIPSSPQPSFIPPTTAYTIIFPFDANDKNFDSSFYSPDLTNGKLSQEEVYQTLKEVEAERADVRNKFVPIARNLFILTQLCLLGMLLIAFLSPEESVNVTSYIILGLLGAFFGAIGILVYKFVMHKKEMKLKCRNVIDKHNQSFASKGLRWHIPSMFPKWIELWKDYQIQGFGIDVTPPVGNAGQQIENNNYPEGQSDNMYTPPPSHV